MRISADQAFSRTVGAPLIPGNEVRLLKDARENYPAWLSAIESAEHSIHFESYIIHEDVQGRRFAEALIAKARAGVKVRLIYDWMGGLFPTSNKFWRALQAQGVGKAHCPKARLQSLHSAACLQLSAPCC